MKKREKNEKKCCSKNYQLKAVFGEHYIVNALNRRTGQNMDFDGPEALHATDRIEV